MKILISGGLGFIGSHLADELIFRGNDITIIDNMSNPCGYRPENAKVIVANLINSDIQYPFEDIDIIFHLASNYSVPKSSENPRFDFENNFLTTFNILEIIRLNDIPKIIFASSSCVYGEHAVFPIKEDAELRPISNYGASKLASEYYIRSYNSLYGIEGLILRMANILGPRSNHGIVPDMVGKLQKDSKKLTILGDGNQRKSYLYIADCISAILSTTEKFKNFDVFNIGSEEWIYVNEIADIICCELHVEPKYEYTGGKRGWKGDVPEFLLDVSKLKSLGWHPKHTTEQAIRETVRWLKSR